MDKIIPVSEEWRLKIEPMNVILQKHHLVKPKDEPEHYTWKLVGYYGSIAQALKAIPDAITLGSQFETLAELNQLLSKLADALQANLTEVS